MRQYYCHHERAFDSRVRWTTFFGQPDRLKSLRRNGEETAVNPGRRGEWAEWAEQTAPPDAPKSAARG
jgi:hypothetical protein